MSTIQTQPIISLPQQAIDYLSPQDFFNLYPKYSTFLTQSNYSTIYETEAGFIIKKFHQDPILRDFTIELNAYASLDHPCIMRPSAWTFDDGIGFLAMPKGKSIQRAYRDGDISLEEIISDCLAVISYMNDRGWVHADLKPDNMVFLNNKCLIIDLGLARPAELNIDGEYYFKGPAHTEYYKDPEYFEEQYNNSKTELYSLARSIVELIEHKEFYKFHDRNIQTKTQNNGYLFIDADFQGVDSTYNPRDRDHIKWLLSWIGLLQCDRPSIKYIMATAPAALLVRRYSTPKYLDLPILGSKEVNSAILGSKEVNPLILSPKEMDPRMSMLMEWLIEVALDLNFEIRTLFLTLHLVHRVYPSLAGKYGEKGIQMLGCAVMNLVLCVCSDNSNLVNVDYWKDISADTAPDYIDRFSNVCVDVLTVTKGVIFSYTYWDYAAGLEDLFPLLKDTVSTKYNPSKIRILHGVSDKSVTIDKVIPKDYKPEFLSLDIPAINDSVVLPSKLDLGSDVEKVIKVWFTDRKNNSSRYMVLLKNRFALHFLNLAQSQFICETLYKERSNTVVSFILDTICHFDWRNRLSDIISSGLHPFQIEKELPSSKKRKLAIVDINRKSSAIMVR
jgi:serine/threonine protein kinase